LNPGVTASARLDQIPSHNDLEVARLAHHALADVPAAGRFGDRKVFIASLWAKMCDVDAQTGGTLTCGATLEHFKAWLLRSRLFTGCAGCRDRRARCTRWTAPCRRAWRQKHAGTRDPRDPADPTRPRPRLKQRRA
jgi:hypothetical protein